MEAARQELRACAGNQFDERVVDALLDVLDRAGLGRISIRPYRP
jgi:HD-GYP domain-containing protein (c-di-GMP phosphodiesterase class II)